MLLLINLQCAISQHVETISRAAAQYAWTAHHTAAQSATAGNLYWIQCLYRRALGTLSIAGKAEFDEHSMMTARVGIGATYAADDATGRVFGGPGHVSPIPGDQGHLRSSERRPAY